MGTFKKGQRRLDWLQALTAFLKPETNRRELLDPLLKTTDASLGTILKSLLLFEGKSVRFEEIRATELYGVDTTFEEISTATLVYSLSVDFKREVGRVWGFKSNLALKGQFFGTKGLLNVVYRSHYDFVMCREVVRGGRWVLVDREVIRRGGRWVWWVLVGFNFWRRFKFEFWLKVFRQLFEPVFRPRMRRGITRDQFFWLLIVMLSFPMSFPIVCLYLSALSADLRWISCSFHI